MKKSNTLGVFATFLLAAVFSWQTASAQTAFTATYTYTGTTGNVASFGYNGTAIPAASFSSLDKVGITSSSSSNNFRGSDWPTGASNSSDVFTGSIDLGKYIGFTITVEAGYTLDLEGITFGVGRSATGPRQWEWRSSDDAFATALADYTTLNGGLTNSFGTLTHPDANSSWTGNELDLSGSAFQGLTGTISFRLYGFNSEANSGTGGLQGPISINGTYSIGGAASTEVNFATTSSSADEDDGSINLVLNISDPSSTNATSVEVVLTSGDASRINGFTSQTVTWSANDGTSKNVSITITDNGDCDGDEPLTFELQNVSGGESAAIGSSDTHVLTVVDDDFAAIDAPVATAGTAVGGDSFTANWGAVTGATGYYLDVYTESAGGLLVEWTFPTSGAAVTASDGIAANLSRVISTSGTGAIGDVGGATTRAATATGWDGGTNTKYWQVSFTTEGYSDITVSSKQFGSNTGPRDFKLQYRVGAGGAWTDVTGANITVGNNWTTGVLADVALPSACDNQEEVFLRWIMTSNTSINNNAVAGGGTSRIDDIIIESAGGRMYILNNEPTGATTSFAVTGLSPNTTYNYVVRAANACGTSDDSNEITVITGTVSNPTLTSSEGSINFGGIATGTTSATQSFSISGEDLDPANGDIDIDLDAGSGEFELSLDGTNWSTGTSVGYTGGELSSTTVYVRFSPTSNGAQTGQITISGGTATDVTVSLSGTGAEPQIYWDFASATPTVDAIAHVSTSDLGRGQDNNTNGNLTNSTSASSGYPGASGDNNAAVSAFPAAFNIGTSSYFDFTITVDAGYFLELTDFNFGSRRTNSGPLAYSVRWDVDGYDTDLFTGTFNNNTNWALHTNDDLGIFTPIGGTVTFRIYGYDGDGGLGTAANWRIDDLDLHGVAHEAAATYYSRGTGAVSDPIWSSTPTGTAGPAVFNGDVSMVVQDGDNVNASGNVMIKDFTVESGASFTLTSGTSMAVHGNEASVEGSFSASDNTTLVLVGADGVILESTAPLNLFNLEVNSPNGALTDALINIRGTLQLTQGEFESLEPVTLVSDASGTGRLGAVGQDADYVGELTVERYIPAGQTNWRMLGSAVADQTVADWKDDFYTAGFPGSHYPSFDRPWMSGNLWPSIRWYNETVQSGDAQAGVTGVSGIEQSLALGQGFIAWSGDQLESTAAFTVSVTGAPHIAKSPLTLPMTWTDSGNAQADGWNLVSNPLPSPIDFTQINRGNDVRNAYYIFDPVAGTNKAWTGGVGQGEANGLVHSSQGFWLKADGSDLATTIDEGAKVNTLSGGLFGGSMQPLLPILALEISGTVNAYSDEATIVFANGTPAYDGHDAPKMTFRTEGAPQLAVRSADGQDLAIDFFGSYNDAISIPLNVGVDLTGTYTITTALSGLNTLGCLTLVDQLTGTSTPLTDGATYTFSMTAGDEANASRFVIQGTKPLPLYVDNALCHGTNGAAGIVSNEGPINLTWTDAVGTPLLTQALDESSADYFEFGAPAGQYMVYLSPAGECGQVSADFTITEPAALEVDVAIEGTSCPASADGSVELAVTGGLVPYTYSWTNGGDDGALHAGEYTVLVTDANGCILPVLVTVPAGEGTIAGFASTGDVVAGVPTNFTNTSILADQYFWDFGDGSTSTEESPVHTWATPGSYNVSLTASSADCSDTFTMEVNAGIGTGIGEASSNNLRVWAAPAQLVIEHPFGSAPVDVAVFDATGRQVMGRTGISQPERILLDSRNLGDGVWFVRITNGDTQRTFRVPLVR